MIIGVLQTIILPNCYHMTNIIYLEYICLY